MPGQEIMDLNSLLCRATVLLVPGMRVPGSRNDSIEESPCKRICYMLSPSGQISSRWCGTEVWRGVWQLRRCPRHLTMVHIYNPCVATKRDINTTNLN
ncbi:hypothetical protein AVEN_259696-1 [Araneus ventricosus]|uniref:Uncharacterized protein n=1 Tax=Araneus ventricosus TaxID=182803 RepID=A0A4Y2PPM7_ARAVE|nr:hypothetical protein AVEN_259696-1 [Araneus ventricosus]